MELKSHESIQPNWSDLPDDILLLISSKLSYSYFDMLSLKGVCSSWRIAMRNKPIRSYLILGLLTEYNFWFFSINELSRFKCKKLAWHHYLFESHHKFIEWDPDNWDRIKMIRHYILKKRSWFHEHYLSHHKVIGSHHDGWLMLLRPTTKVLYILHLFLNIQIELPNELLGTNGSLIRLVKIRKVILSVDGPNSPEDVIVVMSCNRGYDSKLAIWRHGNLNWRCFGGGFINHDVAFCGNTIYALNSFHGDQLLESWDLRINLPLPEKKLSIKLFGASSLARSLVVSSGEEVFLLSSFMPLVICKYDCIKKRCTEEVDSLNGQTLLSSPTGSIILFSSIDADEHFRSNTNTICSLATRNLLISRFSGLELGIYCFDDTKPKLIWNSKGTYDHLPHYYPNEAFWFFRTI